MDGHVSHLASAHWDDHFRVEPVRARDWLELQYVRDRYINPAISGAPDVDWLGYVCPRFIAPAQRVLEIGCGAVGVGFDLCSRGAAQRAVGVDVSAEAIRRSRERSESAGLAGRLDYVCSDIASLKFDDASFDCVVVNMALHHVLELELLFANVQRWKTPNACFVLNEYVGPDRFQWTDATLREGQRLLESLDPRYRVHGVSGELVTTFRSPEYAAMVRGDASEAIRSSAIEPLLSTYFQIVDRRPYGGTVLHWLLADIAYNFDAERRPEDAAELDRLFAEERALLSGGQLSSNFAVIVAR
jgi:ubiquinone/menaquinone biosynthesis C-methylase UbiE